MRMIRHLILRLTLVAVILSMMFSPRISRGADTNELTIGTLEAVGNLDPADSYGMFNWEVLTHLYTGLTRQKPNSIDYELALAATHTVSPDGLTHIFTVRADAAFDDGTPITAQTFADSIQRVLALRGKGAAAITPYVKDVSVSPTGELVFRLTAPLPYFLQLVALPPYFPVNPLSFPKDTIVSRPAKVISNGVYRVSDASGLQVNLEANPAWRGTPPKTARIILKHYTLTNVLRDALTSGEVQVAWHGLPPQDITIALKQSGMQGISKDGLQVFYLLINQKEIPFRDLAVRQGISRLLDRDRAVRVSLGDTAQVLTTLLPSAFNNSSQTPTFPTFSVDEAAKILKSGGYSSFKTVDGELNVASEIYGSAYAVATDVLVTTLTRQEAIRIVRLDTEAKTFLDQIDRGVFRLMILGFMPIVPHPAAYLRPLLDGTIAHSAQYIKPEITALLDQAATASDPGTANDLYLKAQAIAAQDLVAIPLWSVKQSIVIGAGVDPKSVIVEANALLRYDALSH